MRGMRGLTGLTTSQMVAGILLDDNPAGGGEYWRANAIAAAVRARWSVPFTATNACSVLHTCMLPAGIVETSVATGRTKWTTWRLTAEVRARCVSADAHWGFWPRILRSSSH